MPIRIRKICRHCGQPIDQQGSFFPWYHTGRSDAPDSRPCKQYDRENSTLAMPKIDVVKLGEP